MLFSRSVDAEVVQTQNAGGRKLAGQRAHLALQNSPVIGMGRT
jgi:hypothetical protein